MGNAHAFVCGKSVALPRDARVVECAVTILWFGHSADARNLKDINDIIECRDALALGFALTNSELNLSSNVRMCTTWTGRNDGPVQQGETREGGVGHEAWRKLTDAAWPWQTAKLQAERCCVTEQFERGKR